MIAFLAGEVGGATVAALIAGVRNAAAVFLVVGMSGAIGVILIGGVSGVLLQIIQEQLVNKRLIILYKFVFVEHIRRKNNRIYKKRHEFKI